jgi:ribosome-binding ATPase YchF (GTP1/OBG family)
MDVAGLVEGASEGKGLGNQFLDDLSGADVFIHIVDSSGETDLEGKQTTGHNPIKDIEMLDRELNMWFFNILKKAWKSFARKAELEKSKFSEAVSKQFSGLKVNENQVKEALLKSDLPEKPTSWTEEDLMKFATNLRKISKPMIIAANKCDKGNSKENIKKLKETFQDYIVIPCSADSELALRKATKKELINYIPGEKNFSIKGKLSEKQEEALNKIKENVLDQFEFGTGVQEVLNKAVFNLLKYIAIFPGSADKLGDSKGNILPDCFLLPPHSTALDFAYYLHTDFGKNFIKAIDARTKMAWGKDKELSHRDCIEIITK